MKIIWMKKVGWLFLGSFGGYLLILAFSKFFDKSGFEKGFGNSFSSGFIIGFSFFVILYLYDSYLLHKNHSEMDKRFEAMRSLLQSMTREEVIKALQAATIKFQTVAVKHNELVLLYEGEKTKQEECEIEQAKVEKLLAQEKYLMTRSMVAELRKDFPWGKDEEWNTFLPKGWDPKRPLL